MHERRRVTQCSPTLLRILGAAHITAAIGLLFVSTFLGCFSLPVIVPALIWLAILGFRLWRPNTRLRTMLRYTHLVLAPLAILLVVYGLFALRAAQRSAEAGGGLLGAVGLIPIVTGLLAGSVSLVSLYVSYSAAFKKPTRAKQSLGGDSGNAADSPTGAPQG